ncbi:hypothetical protein Tco_0255681 [Tanacetum coccineum]
MITYLKNIGRFTYNQLKNKSFKEIQKLYEKEQKWIKDFIPMDSEEGEKKAASSKKRPRAKPDEESVKRQKIRETSGSDWNYALYNLPILIANSEFSPESIRRENVDYPELIWEDFSYHIDHRKEKRSRCEDYPEYGLPIPDVMLTDAIKHSESYQMFIKYSTNQIPPKKSIGKGLKDAALELAKSISQTKAKEAEATRKVHAIHARILTEVALKSTKKKSNGRSSKSVVIQDTPSTPKLKTATLKTKLQGISSKPGVPDESIVVSATSSEGTSAKPGVPDEDKDITKENVILEWGDEQDSEFFDDDNDDVEKDNKDGDADDEGDDHICMFNEEDVKMKYVEVEESDKGEEKVTDAAKEEAEKTSEAKDDTKKSKLPPSSLSLSVSLGFGDQFLKLSSDSSLVSTLKDFTDADVSSLLDIPIQHETPQTQSPLVLKILVLVIPETTNLPPIPEIVTETHAVPESNALTVIELRVEKLEKDMSELKTVDHSSKVLAVL